MRLVDKYRVIHHMYQIKTDKMMIEKDRPLYRVTGKASLDKFKSPQL